MDYKNIKIIAILLISGIVVTGFVMMSSSNEAFDKGADQFLSDASKAMNPQNQSPTKPLPIPNNRAPASHTPAFLNGSKPQQQVSRGPKADFLQVTPSSQWQKVEQEEGIASIKYHLQHDSNHYELAVIRMNGSVPLASVLSIWQQKVGLAPESDIQYQPFKTKRDQVLKLTALEGQQKTIQLAIHQGNDYTFFRLSGDHQISKEVLDLFKTFLSDAYIID